MEAKGEKALRVQKEVLMVPRIQKVGQKVQNCQILEKEAKGEKVPRDQTIMERMLEMEAKGEKALRVQKKTLLVTRDQKIVEKTLEMERVQRVQKEVLRVLRDQKMVDKILEMEAKGEKVPRVQKEEMDQKEEAKVLKVPKVLEKMEEVVAMEKDQKVLKVQEEIQGKILEKFLHLVLLAQTLKLLYVLDHALVNLEILLKDSQLMVL